MENNENSTQQTEKKHYVSLNKTDKQSVLVPVNEENPFADVSKNTYTQNVICTIQSKPFQFTQETQLNTEEIYYGRIVGYSTKKVFLIDGEGLVYITFKCELYSNQFGGFIAPYKVSANLTSHSNFSHLLQCFDISLTDKSRIKLDDLIGTKIACTVKLVNGFWIVNTISGR